MSELQERAGLTVDACPLAWSQQRRNLILFALCTGMQYLAAPVLYVGITQASLCNKLGADARTANLPSTLFFAMTAMPALIAWLSPRVAVLRRNLSLCYAICAVMLATIAVTLALAVSDSVKLAMVILQGGVAGAVMPAAIAFLWEAIGRGSDESKRGLALSLAFGAGPILAVLGSMAQMALLGGNFFGWTFEGTSYPWNFVALFGAGCPVMALAAVFGQFLIVPPAAREAEREPASAVVGLLVGLPLMFAAVYLLYRAGLIDPAAPGTIIRNVADADVYRIAGYVAGASAAAALVYHFRSILRQRTLLLATLVTILVYSGNMIPSNMNLFSSEVLGDSPEKYAGLQNTLRFSFKVLAGFSLGWMLTRTNPRAGVLATSVIFLAAQAWALCATGKWYLLAFGIYGAGELIGVYAPNYIVSASRGSDLRLNMAFMTMMMAPAAPAGYLYGTIVDLVKSRGWTAFGMTSTALGFRLSFLVCGLFILGGIIFALTLLPKQPRPERSDDDTLS
jgi:MFS family permease